MDYAILTVGDQLFNATRRLGQLEAEHAATTLLAREQAADPHATDAQRLETQQGIESIEARLAVIRDEVAALDLAARAEASEADATGASTALAPDEPSPRRKALDAQHGKPADGETS